MRFTLPAETFVRALEQAAPAASSRGAVEILRGSRWQAKGGRLLVTCTDMQATATVGVAADVAEAGELVCAVPTAAQLKALKALKGETVTVESAESAVLHAGTTECTLRLAAAEDWPAMPDLLSNGTVHGPGMLDVLGSVLPSVSTDQSRPILSCVGMECGEDGTLFVHATDSYRMRVRSLVTGGTLMADGRDTSTWHVHGGTCGQLVRALKRKGAGALVGVHGTADFRHAGFTVGYQDGSSFTLADRLTDGQAVNWRQLLPDRAEFALEVDRQEMLDRVARIRALVKTRGNTPLRCKLGEWFEMTLDNMDGVKASDRVGYACSTPSAEPMEIGVNPVYWQEGFESFADDSLTVDVLNPLRPMVVRSAGHTRETPDFYLVMPIRLAG